MVKNLVRGKSSYSRQTKTILITSLATLIPLSSVLITVHLTTTFPLENLTRDPSAVAEIPPYIGIFSNIGILFWCACTAICLFSYQILKKANKFPEYTTFFLYAGLLTALLLVDDLFLLHEAVFPEYLIISERLVYTSYLIICLMFFVRFKKIFPKTEYLILLAAIISFVISIISDTIWEQIPNVVEDMFKLVGITNWFTYFLRLCLLKINSIYCVSPVESKATLTHADKI